MARQISQNLVLQDRFFTEHDEFSQDRAENRLIHTAQRWFRLKPDLLVKHGQSACLVLDAKWKLLDAAKKNGREKYQLSQADFYQLYAYGHHYLDGTGDIVLIYPKTDAFTEPLPVFNFPKVREMRLWVLPFCLKERRLKLPASLQLQSIFVEEKSVSSHS